MSVLVDLHVHSWASPCSSLTPAVIGRDALARGLDGVAVVDHDRLPDPQFLAELRRFGLRVFAGAEIATQDGDLLVFGLFSLPQSDLPGPETARLVWRQGGAAIVAHPFRRSRPASPGILDLPGLVMEERNGRCTDEENQLAHWTRLSRGCAATGGSDAHEPGEAGMAATRFERLPVDERDLVHLLRAGRCAAWSPHRSPGEAPALAPLSIAV